MGVSGEGGLDESGARSQGFCSFFYLFFLFFYLFIFSLACFEQSLCQILNPPHEHHHPPPSPAPPTPCSKKVLSLLPREALRRAAENADELLMKYECKVRRAEVMQHSDMDKCTFS